MTPKISWLVAGSLAMLMQLGPSAPPAARGDELDATHRAAAGAPARATDRADAAPVQDVSGCGEVTGLGGLRADRMLLFGEIHGTDRSPAAFGSVVCHVGRTHGAVVVGLEISHTEQARIDAYLESPGGPQDRVNLLNGEFWTAEYQDGRRSQAMADLLEELRRLGQAGVEVELVAFDPLPGVPLGTREEHLARRLIAAREAWSDRPFLVLVGNLHARTRPGRSPIGQPMAVRMASAGIDLLAIDIRHAGGSAWICTGSTPDDCRILSLKGSGSKREIPDLELFSDPEAQTGYAGALWVGTIEASPPAASSKRGASQ